MKMIIVAFSLVALGAAAPPVDQSQAQIIRSVFEQKPEGPYNFNFETENGIARQENGELKEAFDEDNKPHTVVVVRGTYSYPREDGKPETVSYYADEEGYHAEGDSIPKNPVSRR